MAFEFDRIEYRNLNAKQKENYNFQKISAVLADYGFITLRLSDDWLGADFIALHTSGQSLHVQLKARLSFSEKYRSRDDLWIAFPLAGEWYLYPHNELLEKVLAVSNIGSTKSWGVSGGYDIGRPGKKYMKLLEPYRLNNTGVVGIEDDNEAEFD